jgi:hypothetical protein
MVWITETDHLPIKHIGRHGKNLLGFFCARLVEVDNFGDEMRELPRNLSHQQNGLLTAMAFRSDVYAQPVSQCSSHGNGQMRKNRKPAVGRTTGGRLAGGDV